MSPSRERDDVPTGVAIIGCGNIATGYAKEVAQYPEVVLRGAFDADSSRADAFASEWDVAAYHSLEAVFDDPSVDIVVNLTPHRYHYEVTRSCLAGGRHVYSEKPLATTASEALELVDLADRMEVRLGCSPSVWLAPPHQRLWHEAATGRIGQVRVVYADMNWGRLEEWHPAPESYYDIGALYDIGVYPLSYLTAMFGPVRRVQGYGTLLEPRRRTLGGREFEIDRPDFVVAVLQTESDVCIRLTTSFYVPSGTSQAGVQVHGDLGSLHLTDILRGDSPVLHAARRTHGGEYAPIEIAPADLDGYRWALGLRDMAHSLRSGRAHQPGAAHAAHVVDVLEAIAHSMTTGRPLEVATEFPRATPTASSLPVAGTERTVEGA